MTKEFWKPKPKPPEEDWIAPWLKWSGRISTVGWIIYGVFALAFDDIAVIPEVFQSWLVILGSALIVMGAEMNTFPMVVAVARKWGRRKAQPLDGVAFAVSLIGSMVAGLIAFSIRQTRLGETGWRALALDIGPLIVGIAIAADFYASGIELGLLKADYETEMEQWLVDERAWNEAETEEPAPAPERATIDDFREIVAQLNGDGHLLSRPMLDKELAKKGLAATDSSAKRWLREHKKEVRK